jgi:hypothetical protein
MMCTKRIIACTTTAAAKYHAEICATAPGILLVEEAGEIQESHTIAAIGSSVKHAVLIGDHKQLRPKISNFHLTVEKGTGYNLNRSLFERLILRGYPHQTLSAQHRMRPEISRLVREMTYPSLTDAPRTANRPDIRGLQKNVVFFEHEHSEDMGEDDSKDRSRTNKNEAELVVQIIKYLEQQGYERDSIVILTSYLSQLHLLRRLLSESHEAILNDLDTKDLIAAGFNNNASVTHKKQIRLATIGSVALHLLACPLVLIDYSYSDNYQGEESDIVVASLTRGNKSHDIGFMDSQERLNVLLSRARDGLIILGNGATFRAPRSGGETWAKLFRLLEKPGGYVFDGLPVQCQTHPSERTVLRSVDDFKSHSPDGGCARPWFVCSRI